MSTFGERLKRARERKGLSQVQVMKYIGITDKSLSRYENNATAPDPETISELIKLYDVSPAYIMGFSPIMGHAPAATSEDENADAGGTSMAAPKVFEEDIHEVLENLSGESRRKAEEYIGMLKTLEEVKSGADLLNEKKKA